MTKQASRWYDGGLQFECSRCGNCCTGPPGAVWFSADEGRAMAAVLGISEETFHRQYARQIRGKWSLRETRTSRGMDCVFLTTDEQGKAGCRLYGARPSQCRTWPFWPENLESRQMWEAVRKQTPCPGMGHGGLVKIDEILARLGETPKNPDL
ncbi:MAG: YkgJ family cysteine cluster protein [Planctomycetes bacterium]|nr:YkgJ family cysteine cluster protein [Planctomycetota bacterium]MCP4838487.1 YkgJ family cysteine cluster protein [Planctomycetota bacterium]